MFFYKQSFFYNTQAISLAKIKKRRAKKKKRKKKEKKKHSHRSIHYIALTSRSSLLFKKSIFLNNIDLPLFYKLSLTSF